MISKLMHMLTLFIGLLACTICLPEQFQTPGQGPTGDGMLHPFAYSPTNGVTSDPEPRQQSTVDERMWGSSVAPAGGAGLGWRWQF